MARKRSPNYPNISLPEAIEKIAAAYPKVHRAKADKGALATLFGYGSLHGSSLTMLGALRQYGLLEGGREEMCISADGETIAIESRGSKERFEAIERCAANPVVFSDAMTHFEGRLPADEIVRPYLIRKGFSTSAVGNVIRRLRETVEFVEDERQVYNSEQGFADAIDLISRERDQREARKKQPPEATGMTQDSFTLDEGKVVLEYPKRLSQESVEYLELWLQLQLRKVKAGAGKAKPDDESTAEQ